MEKDLALTKRCLTIISRIAARGATSPIDEHAFDTLMELQVYLSTQQPAFDCEARLGWLRTKTPYQFAG